MSLPLYPVEQTVPHRPPMLLLDAILERQHEHLSSTSLITPAHPFSEGDAGVPAWVGIELMAQTIAALAGSRNLDAGHAIRIGFLVGCRAYEAEVSHFLYGQQLTTSAQLVLEENSELGVFDCQIHCQQQLLASARLNAFQPLDLQQFLATTSG